MSTLKMICVSLVLSVLSFSSVSYGQIDARQSNRRFLESDLRNLSTVEEKVSRIDASLIESLAKPVMGKEDFSYLFGLRYRICRSSPEDCLKVKELLSKACRVNVERNGVSLTSFWDEAFSILEKESLSLTFSKEIMACARKPSEAQLFGMLYLYKLAESKKWEKTTSEILTWLEGQTFSIRAHHFFIDLVPTIIESLSSIRPYPLANITRLAAVSAKLHSANQIAKSSLGPVWMNSVGDVLVESGEGEMYLEKSAKLWTQSATIEPDLLLPILQRSCAIWRVTGELEKCQTSLADFAKGKGNPARIRIGIGLEEVANLEAEGKNKEGYEKAQGLLKLAESVQLTPLFPWIQLQLGQLALNLNELQTAEKHLSTHSRLLPESNQMPPWTFMFDDVIQLGILRERGEYEVLIRAADAQLQRIGNEVKGDADISLSILLEKLYASILTHNKKLTDETAQRLLSQVHKSPMRRYVADLVNAALKISRNESFESEMNSLKQSIGEKSRPFQALMSLAKNLKEKPAGSSRK